MAPPTASATFHFMNVREVYPGGADGGSYVVLQMYSSAQNFVGGHSITVHNASGSTTATFTFSGSVPNGANQATILVADDGYGAAFPGGPAPDATDSGLHIPVEGGAVCFDSIDCVSWGNFGGSVGSPTGAPASPAGVTAGAALHRSIAANCSTLLEAADDTNDSDSDFSEQTPNPRSNSSPIAETTCTVPDTTPPIVSITQKPADPGPGAGVSFKYHANETSSFECRLDGASFAGCAATGISYDDLEDGEHTFEVRATDLAGNLGSPAAYTWTVDNSLADTTPPETTITAMPPNPSDSSIATFEYSSNEPGSSFECKLDGGSFVACPVTGVTYTGLTSGAHTFQVRAIDPDDNVDPSPAGYSFGVVVLAPEPPSEPSSSSSPSPDSGAMPDPPAGTVVAAGLAQVRGALALLRVRCLGRQGARCRGLLRLVVRLRVRRGRRLVARNVVIGSARHNLPAGRAVRAIRVRLTARGRRLVSRSRGRRLRARLVGSRARNRVVTLRPAKQRASRRHGSRAQRRGAGR